MALVSTADIYRDPEDLPETAVEIASLARAMRADLVQPSHRFQVSRTVLENPEQPAFAVAQLLGALGHLLFESQLGFAQFLFVLLLQGQVGDDDADGICLRLESGERD